MTHSHGLLIAVEGIDGSGKSSLVRNLAHRLQPQHDIIITKEPGGSQLGMTLRTLLQEQPVPIDPRAEYLLFAADRAQHMKEIIKPALHAHKIVLSDRLGDSSVVYQGYGRGLDIDMIQKVNAWAMDGVTPNLTIYVKINSQTATDRIIERGKKLTAFEKEAQEFFKKLIDGYDTLYAKRSNVLILDGTLAPDVLAQQAYDAITKI